MPEKVNLELLSDYLKSSKTTFILSFVYSHQPTLKKPHNFRDLILIFLEYSPKRIS